MNRFLPRLLPLIAVCLVAPAAAQSASGWSVVDYADLLDRRQLSQSGETIGMLIEQLDGRPVPPPGQRADDRRMHVLLDPLVEPYGFVLSDALDRLEPPHELPLVEVGQLWQPGERQPAWVELLRSRRFVVESDGAGRLRVALPWTPSGNPQEIDSEVAAGQAWDAAWPVLRHVFAAERRRLGEGRETPPALDVRAYAYAHSPAKSLFLLGKRAHRVSVGDTRSTGDRPPLDLGRLSRFLESGWTLEGGRLDAAGRLTPFGSKHDRPATLLGRGLNLADLAVAFRAVSHGGIAEPGMSLDRGPSPWTSIVSYGGRLRDTSLGWVSLLCDVRFKTFSVGLGIEEGSDLRERMRASVPSFRTHVEHFADDPASASVFAQQTRLWFYPDRVDLTVAPQSDVLAMRRVRMSAASERLADETFAPGAGDDPAWTKATIDAINEHYDGLAAVFPELADLDQVVRVLSFFTWLDLAARAGTPVPDVDALLAVELPALPTPRTFPQMLSFNALPPAGARGVVESFDRVPVVDALDMLNPRQGALLEPSVRLQRAVAALDRGVPEEAAFIDRVGGTDLTALSGAELDLLAYRAQRLRMHRTIQGAFDPELRAELDQRAEGAGRIFSVGVGGLDLGMRKVLGRARSRSLALVGAGTALPREEPATTRRVTAQTRARWREEPAGLPPTKLPDHGLGGAGLARDFASGWIERTPGVSGDGGDEGGQVLVVQGAAGPDAVARRVRFDGAGKPHIFERFEAGRKWRYRLDSSPRGLRAISVEAAADAAPAGDSSEAALPDGLAMLSIDPGREKNPTAAAVELRLRGGGSGELDAAVPRWVLQRLVLGRQADLAHDPSLPGIAPLPPSLGEIETLMVLGDASNRRRPWDVAAPPVTGEQDSIRVAAAINAWWDAPDALPAPGGAVVGIAAKTSPGRWSSAPRAGSQALLVLPPDGFPQTSAALPKQLRDAWSAGRVSERADPSAETLVLVVSAEAPGPFAARLRAIAEQPSMRGRLLAGWSLAGPIRDDLAPWILESTGVAGVGLAEGSVVSRRNAPGILRAIAAALESRGKRDRVESIPGPFLWFF